MSEKEVQAHPAPPDTKSWLEYSWKLQQEAPNRFEDAAKFLATIISLTVTIIFTAPDKLQRQLVLVTNPVVLPVVLCIWLMALFFALLVLFPQKYAFHSKSIETIKSAQARIVRRKRAFFILATVLYFLPLLFITVLYFGSIMKSDMKSGMKSDMKSDMKSGMKSGSHYEKANPQANLHGQMPVLQGPSVPGGHRDK